MCKRLCKNAILAVCVLALVLYPINVSAADYTYNNISNFIAALNTIGSGNEFYYNIGTSVNSGQYSYLKQMAAGYGFDQYNGFYYVNQQDGSMTYFPTTATQFTLISDSASGGVMCFYTGVRIIATSNNTTTTRTGAISFLISDYDGKIGFFPEGLEQARFVSGDDTYIFDINYTGGSGSGTGGGGTIDAQTANYIRDIVTFLSFNMHGYVSSANSGNGAVVNSNWINLGQFLTYDYLCKTNLNSPTVGVYQMDGTTLDTLPNYLYAKDHDYSSDLSSIGSTLGTISSRINTTNSRLTTTNNTLSDIQLAARDTAGAALISETHLSDMKDRLEMAFPDDQAEMNDTIADQILDDSNDTGLSVNRITSAKSDLDDGLSTFKLDTSNSQYSNPFSALDDADWSFWSQTTVNNLGSGYSYSFGEGSLMSENDVFTENQSVLLNLLGW